jgi:hypothetical protein
VVVGEVDHFGDDVVYLKVDSPGLVDLHRSFVQAIGPTSEEIANFHEMEGFVPHLTLSQSMPEQGMVEVGSLVESAKGKFNSPVRFICGSVKIYRAPSEFEQYRVFKEYMLGFECRH